MDIDDINIDLTTEFQFRKASALAEWLNEVNLVSGDPFALQCSSLGIKVSAISPLYIPAILSKTDQRFPSISNRLVAHRMAAQSAGIYVQSCILMSRILIPSVFKVSLMQNSTKYYLKWLAKNGNIDYTGVTWGVPFQWVMGTGVLAPANTPLSTVTPYCSDAFYLAGKYCDYSLSIPTRVLDHIHSFCKTPKEHLIDIATSNAEFITNDLKHTYDSNNSTCLSYSPLDEFHVVNVNAYCAAQLYRAYHYTSKQEYKDLADRLIQYLLEEQNDDGSWYYWASQQPVFKSIDSLHQCYIMQGMYRCYIAGCANKQRVYDSVMACMDYCKSNLITATNCVKKFPNQKRPYELIDASEMISTMDMIGDSSSEELLKMTIDRFSIPKKQYFASWLEPRNNIPYIRWGQSQFLFAMIQHILLKNKFLSQEGIYL